MGLTRRNAIVLYIVTLVVTFGIASNATGGIGNIALSGLASIIIAIMTIYYLVKNYDNVPKIESKPDQSTQLQDNENPSVQLSIPINPPTKRARLYYLDNLKSILTGIVVIHHVTGMFAGKGWIYNLGNYYNSFLIPSTTILVLNQSYFMCLFFFISGYFTPTSCDRKGIPKFLQDKFKRLGIPFILYIFILGPALDLFIHNIAIKHNKPYTYFPDPGPCWFLAWLLIFNVCYTIIDASVPILKRDLPSLSRLIISGIFLGFIQSGLVFACGNFIMMPVTYGSLPFDILFFIAGVMAKRNGWLPQIVSTNYNIFTVRVLTIIVSFLEVGIVAYCYFIHIGYGYVPPEHESPTDCDSKDYPTNGFKFWRFVITSLLVFIVSGVATFVVSLFMIQCTAIYLNFQNKYTKFLSRSAYTVYLIHPWIITPIGLSFTLLLDYFKGIKMFFCKDSGTSKTHFDDDYLVYVGWIYSIILSLIIVWPLSHFVRQLPGLNKIL